jgi:hypothetical protein
MTLTALTKFVKPKVKAEVFQVERGGDGHVSIYFFATDPKSGKVRTFVVTCDQADEIRVWPGGFEKLRVEAKPLPPDSVKSAIRKKGSIIRFGGEMYIVGYGFSSHHVDVGDY